MGAVARQDIDAMRNARPQPLRESRAGQPGRGTTLAWGA